MVKRLIRAPLVEVIWKIQFEPGETILSLIHGVLYSELRKKYQKLYLQRLPMADLPDSVVRFDPNLRDFPKYVILSEGSQLLWQVGMGIVTLNCRRSYVGWQVFKQEILNLCDILQENELVTFPASCSFRYVNLIEKHLNFELSDVKLEVRLLDDKIQDRFQFRTEIDKPGKSIIFQCGSPVSLRVEDGVKTGLLIDIEAKSVNIKDWGGVKTGLDTLHDAAKEFFFALITERGLEKFEPEY